MSRPSFTFDHAHCFQFLCSASLPLCPASPLRPRGPRVPATPLTPLVPSRPSRPGNPLCPFTPLRPGRPGDPCRHVLVLCDTTKLAHSLPVLRKNAWVKTNSWLHQSTGKWDIHVLARTNPTYTNNLLSNAQATLYCFVPCDHKWSHDLLSHHVITCSIGSQTGKYILKNLCGAPKYVSSKHILAFLLFAYITIRVPRNHLNSF